jgi:hypothetical protein
MGGTQEIGIVRRPGDSSDEIEGEMGPGFVICAKTKDFCFVLDLDWITERCITTGAS